MPTGGWAISQLTGRGVEGIHRLFLDMRILLLMGNWGEGLAILFGLVFLLVAVPVTAIIGHLWDRHIEK